MEFKNRQSTNPGRITLRNVVTGEQTTYEVVMADGATQEGTPLNAETFAQFKQDIMDSLIEMGVKGEKGEPGTYIKSITLSIV